MLNITSKFLDSHHTIPTEWPWWLKTIHPSAGKYTILKSRNGRPTQTEEIASATKTEIILPGSNKTIRARTPLVLMGTKMNVMTEPLHRTDKALPRGLHVCLSYGTYNYGSQKMTIQLYNTKDHAIIINKGTAVVQMEAANDVQDGGGKWQDGGGKWHGWSTPNWKMGQGRSCQAHS